MTENEKAIKNPEKFGPVAKMALDYINNYVEYIRNDLDCSDEIARARTMQLVIILNTLQEEMLKRLSKSFDLNSLPEARLVENGDTSMAMQILNERMKDIKQDLTALVMVIGATIEVSEDFLYDRKDITELEALKIKKSLKEMTYVASALNEVLTHITEFMDKK